MLNIFRKRIATTKDDVLSGLTVALALVPEAIAFAFVAAFSSGIQANLSRFRLLLGRRTLVLANGWCLDYCGGLYGRLD